VSSARVGGWIQTFSGRRFYPLDARADEIEIGDVAHALSHLCRFAGHTRRFYSVGEHSVHVAEVLRQAGETATTQLWGLLHDAPEAYLVDLPRPIKHSPGLEPYRAAEHRLALAVSERFGLSEYEPPAVKAADDALLVTERRDLMAPRSEGWDLWAPGVNAQPVDGLNLVPATSPAAVRSAFLLRYERLEHDRKRGR
jgi:hypothetical protein